MSSYNYFPILKTTDAELRAYAELPSRVQEKILPVFELTRSRRSKNNPDADAWKRIESIEELCSDRPFILDLTTESTLQNSQIEGMLNSSRNGFDLWVTFVKRIAARGLRVIPVIHYNPDDLHEVRNEIKKLQDVSDVLAFRVKVDDEVGAYVREIGKTHSLDKLILILDAGYLEPGGANPFPDSLNSVAGKKFRAVVCAASSFPSSVANYGDEHGSFPIMEVTATEQLLAAKQDIYHGDFGSIHPVRYEGRWGGWVPRIDFPSGNTFRYYRYRRDQGGYTKAARRVIADRHYKPITEFSAWGDSEIKAAANGGPNGKSPSHWISVRANLYIAQQYLRLSAKVYSRMSL